MDGILQKPPVTTSHSAAEMLQISISIPPRESFSTTCASHYSTKTERKSAVLGKVTTDISNSHIFRTSHDGKQVLVMPRVDKKWEVVKQEFLDGVRVNHFFTPWISSMLLLLGLPHTIAKTINPLLCCAFAAPVIVLEIKIYGQWFSGGERMLSRVSNPSTYLSIVGNFVSAMMAARVGWKEPANFLFAVGFAHYTVLFVTLYQRLPTNPTVPKDHYPTFFLFLAAPSTACVAWEDISGTFGFGSKIPYFLSLFLFASMVVRIRLFARSRFSIAWWAYAFPMTAVAIASIRYTDEVRSSVAKIVAILFSVISITAVGVLVIGTAIHYLVYGQRIIPLQQCIGSPSKKRKRTTSCSEFQIVCSKPQL